MVVGQDKKNIAYCLIWWLILLFDEKTESHKIIIQIPTSKPIIFCNNNVLWYLTWIWVVI